MGSIYPQPRAWVFPTDVFHVLQAKGKDAFFGEDVSVGVRDLWAWAPGLGVISPPGHLEETGVWYSLGTLFLGKDAKNL